MSFLWSSAGNEENSRMFFFGCFTRLYGERLTVTSSAHDPYPPHSGFSALLRSARPAASCAPPRSAAPGFVQILESKNLYSVVCKFTFLDRFYIINVYRKTISPPVSSQKQQAAVFLPIIWCCPRTYSLPFRKLSFLFLDSLYLDFRSRRVYESLPIYVS